MVLPERHHAAQQIRTPQERAAQPSRSADHDMAAAAGCGMASVVVEFLSGQPILAHLLDKHRVDLYKFVPTARWRQIDFQNAGVRSNAKRSHPGIGGRSIAL